MDMDVDLFGQPICSATKSRPGFARKPNRTLIVAAIAIEVARQELDSYSCATSRHDFTQPQLMAILVLKAYHRQTYRGIIELLELSDQLQKELGLKKVPNFATLAHFSKRISPRLIDRMVARVLQLVMNDAQPITELAVDSTGVETHSASVYYVDRSGKERERYVKISLVVACTSLMLVAMTAGFGPTPDRIEEMDLLWRASGRCQPNALYADSGYDLEAAHVFCREGWGVSSWIPPVPRGGSGVVKSEWRSWMRPLPYSYGRRWHVESFISGMKRTTGSSLRARREDAMLTEASLNVLAYAIRRRRLTAA